MKNEVITASSNSFVKAHRVLLTEEEERELFIRWKKYSSEADLTKIIVSYSPIIRRSIKELAGYRMDPEELVSEGLIALVEAARRFDLSRNLRFSTYAKTWVKGVMYGFITKNYFLVHVCTSHTKKKLFFALRKLIAINMKKTGNFELTHKMAEGLAVEHKTTVTEIQCMYDMFKKPHDSLSEAARSNSDGEITKGDLLASTAPSIEDQVILSEVIGFQKQLIKEAMKKVLDKRERRIFIAQSLQDKEDTKTLETLGKEFSISKERVRQIRNDARYKLEKELKNNVAYMGMEPSDMFV